THTLNIAIVSNLELNRKASHAFVFLCNHGQSLDLLWLNFLSSLYHWDPASRDLSNHVTGHGSAFQISAAYSAIVRSLENLPERATLIIAFLAQVSGSMKSLPTRS